MAEFVQDIPHRRAFGKTAAIVLPDALVNAVVEVEEFQILELAGGRAEQLLGQLDERVHRSAHVQKQQQLHRVALFRPHLDVEPALLGRARNRCVDIQLVGGPFAREAAQTAQRHLDVAGAQFARVVQVLELALVPDLDRFLVLAFPADTHAFGVVAGIAIGGGAAGADPFIAALMALFLLGKALLHGLHQLVPVADLFDRGHLFLAEIFFGDRLQPVQRDILLLGAIAGLQSLEDLGEDLIEPVQLALVLHQRGAGEKVELLRPPIDHIPVQRLQQHEMLLQRYPDPGAAQFVHERIEHRLLSVCVIARQCVGRPD